MDIHIIIKTHHIMKKITRTSFVFGTKKVLASNKRSFVYIAPVKRGVPKVN